MGGGRLRLEVGRVDALGADAHVGRGSCCAFAVDCAGLGWSAMRTMRAMVRKDQMKSGQDEPDTLDC